MAGYLPHVVVPSHVLEEDVCSNAGLVRLVVLADVDHRLHNGHEALAPRVQAIDDGLQPTVNVTSSS